MARNFLSSGDEAEIGFVSSGTELFGTNGNETVTVKERAHVIFDASFNRGGDIINIAGNASSYSATVVGGSRLVLTGQNGSVIDIPVGGVGVVINFDDADGRILKFNDAGQLLLGTQVISVTGETVVSPGTEEPNPQPGTTILLNVSRDNAVGTAGNDTFDGGIAQNNNGEQANTLGTGDRIDGLGGYDKLVGTIQDASPLNAEPSSSIAPIIRNVEDIQLTAYQAWDGIDENYDGIPTGVGINAKDIMGHERLGSFHSDTSLTYFNVNTLPGNAQLGDEEGARKTSAITIRMERTGPATPLNDSANLTVLFDNDYLLRAPNTASGATIRIQMMDLDSALTGKDPLLNNPYNAFQFTIGGQLVSLPIDLTTGTTYEAVRAAFQIALDANPLTAGKVTAVLGPVFTANDTDNDPGGSAPGTEILLVNSGPEVLAPIRFVADQGVPTDLDFHLQTYTGAPEETPELITSVIELEKVGNLGDGGYLTVGGMAVVAAEHYYDSLLNNTWKGGQISRPGVEKFIIHVEGVHNAQVDESSSLAGVQSTHNALQQIVIDNPNSTADLTIGNSQTLLSSYVNGAVNSYWDAVDVSSVRNNAVKDVLVFDASAFTAKSTVHAYFSDEAVAKYMQLSDTQANPRTDNIVAQYLFGSGDNTLNLNISKNNAAYYGNAAREDFEVNIETNGGNDLVQFQIGDGQDSGLPYWYGEGYYDVDGNWYVNHAINSFGYVGGTAIGNDRYKDMQIQIDTGTGNDKVETWGATVAHIVTGDGHDVIFTDNSGEENVFNEGHATWVFNQSGDYDINNLQSQTRVEVPKIANLGIRISYQDIELSVPVIVGGSNTANGVTITDLTINQAIKDAINNDPVLKDLLVARDGPGRTLIVESKIDGVHTENDLTLSLYNTAALTTQQIAAGAQLLSTWLAAAPGNAALLGFTTASGGSYVPITGADQRWDSEFATLPSGDALTGIDSWNTNNNVVDAGLGNDTIVLSSHGTGGVQVRALAVGSGSSVSDGSVETVDINGLFGNDVIFNFTAAVGEGGSREVQTLDFNGTAIAGGDVEVTIDGVTFSIPVDGVSSGPNAGDEATTAAEVAAAVAAYVNTPANGFTGIVTATADAAGVVTLNYLVAGQNFPQATVEIIPDVSNQEVQTIEFSVAGGGATLAAGSIKVTFDGVTSAAIAIGAASSDTPEEVAALVANWFNTNAPTTVQAVDNGDGSVTLTYLPGNAAVSPAVVEITQNPVPDQTYSLDYIVTTQTDGYNFGLTVVEHTTADGLPPVAGWDIFDLTTVMGAPVAANFINQQAAHTAEEDGSTFDEKGDIQFATTHGGTIAIIDTYSAADYGAGAPTTELARVTASAKAVDTAASATVLHSVVITVDADNVGTFYYIQNGTAANDTTVTLLGTVELAQYNDASKVEIGEWNLLTIANFTPLTAETVVDTFNIV